MRWKLLLLSLLLVQAMTALHGQTPDAQRTLSNLRQKWISTNKDTVRLDSFSIIPNSLKLASLPDSLYELDIFNSLLIWKTRPAFDSVLVKYRVFPSRLTSVAQRMSFDTVMKKFYGQPFVPDFGEKPDDRFFEFGNLTYNGSFGRGISFGNSQDAVVTSNLNLQLNGFLADSIEIAAAITDNNIPIQPDGTTQQLNEFDRIFLQFRKKGWQLSLGDIDLRQNQSYFMSFYKRLQGIAFENTSSIGARSSNRTIVSGSIAKGKFTRNLFQGQEGNQGPYRLRGANNEFYFVVLANTERVYIDGELLQRGEDQDYVINYNTAEIAFTPRRMITKDSRIQVEFEYSDRNYLNANLYAFNETNINERLRIRVGAFNNSDAKNSPINQTLDQPQKQFLHLIGDNINRAFYPNAVQDTLSAGKILYRKIDTLYDGGLRDSIYVYSAKADSTLYNLTFIEVGAGFGDYEPEFNGANGKVYRWVKPVNGQKQGRFLPAVFLVTPKKQQLITVGADYDISKKTNVSVEWGMSNYDINTLSTKDKYNDQGHAIKTSIRDTRSFNQEKKLELVTSLGFEHVQKEFKPIERLRNVEYTRDWGLSLVVEPEDETIVTASVGIRDQKANTIQYQFTNYRRGSVFTGIRNQLAHVQEVKSWKFNNLVSLSNTNSTYEKGYFFRPALTVTRVFPKLKNYSLSGNFTMEHNEIRSKTSDSVAPQSFSFSIIQAALKSPEEKLNRWGIIYFQRTDAYPYATELLKADRSQNINLFADLLSNTRHQFRLNTTYRKLEVINKTVTNQKADESLLGRIEYQVNEWKGFVTGNLLYEVGAGQEQKRDYAFLEVPAGQGEYTWIDYNSDGIQSLNEFEIALFQDQAKFIRIFTPTNEFIKANYNTFNYSIGLNPRSLISTDQTAGLLKLIGKINLQSSLQINKKEVASGIVQLNPFSTPLNDSSLITLTSIFINTFSYNRFSSVWGFDINNARNSNKALLTYGYETRSIDEWAVKTRLSITKEVLIDLTGKTGNNQLKTSNVKFDNRNYDIRQYSLEPRITFTYRSNFRLITGYRFSDKQNQTGSEESSLSHSINSEIRYNALQTVAIQGKFTYNAITFRSKDSVPNANSTAAYVLLEGLQPGKNYLWNIDLTKRLSNSLELNIQYEGRKPGTARIVHIGRASIRALL